MEATVAIFQNYWAYHLCAESVRLITEASALLTERGAHGAVSLIPRENQEEHFL